VNPGTGFTTTPTFTITGGTGSGAAITGNDGAFALNGFVMTNHGSGYTTAPTVNVTGGTAAVTAKVAGISLASDSSIGGSGGLIVHSIISGSHSLTKVGSGTTVLAASNTYTGTTLVSDGNLQVGLSDVGTTGTDNVTLNGSSAVLSGSGNITGPVTSVILGTIKPGDQGGAAAGSLNSQSLVFTPASLTTVAEFQLTGSTGGSNLAFDTLHITGDLTLNGFSRILVDGTGYTPTTGDTFALLDWTGLLDAGAFSTGSNFRTGANADLNEGLLDLPDISGVGFWDVAFGSGSLTLTVVVPEPSRIILLLLGSMSLLMRRRR
jgi:autotransporter-associated beta strand protein